MRRRDKYISLIDLRDLSVGQSNNSPISSDIESKFNPDNENLKEDYGIGLHTNFYDLRAAEGFEKENILSNIKRQVNVLSKDKELDYDKLQKQYGYSDEQILELKNAIDPNPNTWLGNGASPINPSDGFNPATNQVFQYANNPKTFGNNTQEVDNAFGGQGNTIKPEFERTYNSLTAMFERDGVQANDIKALGTFTGGNQSGDLYSFKLEGETDPRYIFVDKRTPEVDKDKPAQAQGYMGAGTFDGFESSIDKEADGDGNLVLNTNEGEVTINKDNYGI